jgi:hypothetical protein
MTAELANEVGDLVAASRAVQGLPPRVEEPLVLKRVAHALLAAGGEANGRGAKSQMPGSEP